jgi:hypothetical protein
LLACFGICQYFRREKRREEKRRERERERERVRRVFLCLERETTRFEHIETNGKKKKKDQQVIATI